MLNLQANIPAIVIAKTDIAFTSAGITALNTSRIYKISPLKSYQPGRPINAITGFETGVGYYIVPLQDMDLSLYVAPKNLLTRYKRWKTGTLLIGDSITAGLLLTGGEKAWGEQVAQVLGITVTNLAVSGAASRQCIKIFMDNCPLVPTKPLGTMFGFNGNRTNPATIDFTPFQNHTLAAHRAMCAIHFQKQILFPFGSTDGSAQMTISSPGSATAILSVLQDWGSRAPYVRAHDGTNTLANWFNKVVAVNATISFTLTGEIIAIGTYGCDGTTTDLSRIKVNVDGVDVLTYNPAGMCYAGNDEGIYTQDGVINDAIILDGLTDTAHLVTLTFLDAKRGVVDYAAVLKTAVEAEPIPFYINDLPHMSAAGYSYVGAPTTQAILDNATAYRKAGLLAVLPDHPLAFIDINAAGYYEPATHSDQIQSDGIHPKELGDTKIANRVLDYTETDF